MALLWLPFAASGPSQNTPWTPQGSDGEGAPLFSEAYRRQLREAGVRLVEPYPDPTKGPQGNCWLLRGSRIRQVRKSSSSGPLFLQEGPRLGLRQWLLCNGSANSKTLRCTAKGRLFPREGMQTSNQRGTEPPTHRRGMPLRRSSLRSPVRSPLPLDRNCLPSGC